VEVSTRQGELAIQSPPEQSGLLASKLYQVKLQGPAVVDEDGVGLSDLAIVVEVEPGNVITTGHKTGVNVDRGLSGSPALRIQRGPKLVASSSSVCPFHIHISLSLNSPLSHFFLCSFS